MKKLISVYLRAHEGNASDYPYCITPQQIVRAVLKRTGNSFLVHSRYPYPYANLAKTYNVKI